MPKNAAKKRSNKQREEKKRQLTMDPANNNSLHKEETDLYRAQIEHLTEELERYVLKCDNLERQRRDFDARYAALETEKKDITEYLKHCVSEKDVEAEELSERLETLQQAAEKDRDALRLLRQQLRDQEEELTQKNQTLAASLEDCTTQTKQLLTTVASLEKKLANQEEQHKAKIHNLEMKALLEKNSREKESESHLTAKAAEVQQLVDQKLTETTRLALKENAELKPQIIKLLEHVQVVMKENSALRDSRIEFTVERDLLKETISSLSHKGNTHKKKLTEKCQQLQVELEACREEQQKLQTEHKQVLTDMEALRQEQASLSSQCSKNRVKVSQLESKLQEEKGKSGQMKSIMQGAAITLRQALMEAPTEPGSEADASVIYWKQLMQRLLVILDTSTLTRSSNKRVTELQAPGPAAAGAESLDPPSRFQFHLARHRPGDLGLVPPPRPKHTLSRSRLGPTLPVHSQKTTSSFNLSGSTLGLKTSKQK